VVVVFGILIALKLSVLLVLGPIHTPDSAGYAQFANLIVTTRDWMVNEHLDWDMSLAGGEPKTIFRAIGYPLLLALAKTISPDNWDWLIVFVQIPLSLVATVYVYRLAHQLTKSLYAALFIAFAQGSSQALLMDQCILTDSLNASLLLIMLCHVGLAILNNRRPSWLEAATLGGLVMIAFLLREAGTYLQILYWPIILYWAVRTMDNKMQAVALVVVFAIPMTIGIQGYKSWNEMRTGERFVTVGGSSAMFFPSIYLEQRGISIFADDPLLSDMGPLPNMSSTVGIIRRTVITHLLQAHDFNMVDIARYGMSNFLNIWLKHPVDMSILTLSHIREKQAMQAFMPIQSVDRTVTWATGQSAFPAKNQLWTNVKEHHRIDQLLMVAGRSISKIVSIVISAAFVFGVPIVMIRSFSTARFRLSAYDPATVLMTLYWLVYLGYTFIYAMIHLEMRYLMPVTPLSIIIGVTLITAIGRKHLSSKLYSEA